MSRAKTVAASSPADLAGRAALSTRKHAAALSDEVVKRLEVAHIAEWLLDHDDAALPAAAALAREAIDLLADAWNRADGAAAELLEAAELALASGLISAPDPVGDPGTERPVWHALTNAVAAARGTEARR